MLFYTIFILIIIQSILSTSINNKYYYRIISLTILVNVILCYELLDVQHIYTYYIYNGSFTVNNVVIIIQIILYLCTFILCNIWVNNKIYTHIEHIHIAARGQRIIRRVPSLTNYSNTYVNPDNYYHSPYIREHTIILLFILIGSIILVCSNSLISIFFSIELQSFALYVLSSIHKNSNQSTAAGLKYIILGGFSSCVLLLGTAILYKTIGTFTYSDITSIVYTTIPNIYTFITISDLYTIYYTISSNISAFFYDDNCIYGLFGIIFIIIGIIFKIGVAPIHHWAPDVYDGTPTIITICLAVIPKIGLIYTLYIISNLFTFNSITANILLITAIISIIIGTIIGTTAISLKRLLTYSTISHVGFILVSITVGTIESYASFIFYILQYTISNGVLFILLICCSYIYNKRWDIDVYYGDYKYVTNLNVLFIYNRSIAIAIAVVLYSLSGIPPIIGFFAKINLLYSASSIGYNIICILLIITSVISTYYYLIVVQAIFFTDYPTPSPIKYPYIITETVIHYNISGVNKLYTYDNTYHRINGITSIISGIIAIGIVSILGFLLYPSVFTDISTILSLTFYYI